MSNILILTSYYLGASTANGICAKNIAKHFEQEGHNVCILCYDQGLIEKNVHTVPMPRNVSSQSKFIKLWKCFKAVFTPPINKKLVCEYKRQAIKICFEHNIDTVVCMFFPIETLSVISKIKSQFPQIHTVVYELDSVGDGISSGSGYRNLVNHTIERWIGKQYRKSDRIIVMDSHSCYWKKKFERKHGHKLVFADIPVLVAKHIPPICKEESDTISFLYGGMIQQEYRSPDHLLAVFDDYAKQHNAVLDFYSKGDCEDKIAKFAEHVEGIKQNGYVPEAVLDEAIAKADALVSIGNKISRSIPSKLITYLSYGKPVIHISSQQDDPCIKYLEHYPLGLVLYEWDSVKNNSYKLDKFMCDAKGKMVDFSNVAISLCKNTPAYSANLILEKQI